MAYYFNLPIITDLTLDQQRAVNETNPLALSGGPGTGKSVVCLWRHIMNYTTGMRNSLLLTYTKTLEHYLRASANLENQNAGNNIDRVFWWLTHNATPYEEIIIDESQDVEKRVFERFLNYSNIVSYGADQRQSIYLEDKELNELLNWFDTDQRFKDNVHITLNRNFRNSKEILLFTRSVFPNFMIPKNTINSATSTNQKPVMKLNLGWGVEGHINAIIDIIDDYRNVAENIAILVPFQSMVDKYYNAIREKLDNSIELTKYKSDDDKFNGLSGVHITPFKSSKGTEFDTVIIPEFDSYDWIIQKFDIISENDYYVAFTRAKTSLFLLCKNGFPNIGDINTVIIE